MVATLVFLRFVFSFRPSRQAWPQEEVPSRLRLSPKVSSPAMGMGAVAASPLREPRTVPIFDLGLVCRADLVRLHPKGNADFGWAVAPRPCGRDQIRADTEALMATGTVKWFNPTKGYGFIQPQDGDRDVFVHISAVERAGLSSLNEGQVVDYEVVSNRGKETADSLKAR